MKTKDATDLRVNEKYREMINNLMCFYGKLKGKKILDVGCDYQGILLRTLVENCHIKEGVGIKTTINSEQKYDGCRIIPADARDIPIESSYFDVVVSLAAFEHFQGLDRSLKEIYRVLKPGGILYSYFGPIWSCYFGHHLWITYEGKLYNYKNTFLPPFAHLLMSRDELKIYCDSKYPKRLSEKIVEFVFESPDQNRLFYEDYREIFGNSLFQKLFFYGIPKMPFKEEYEPDNYLRLLKQLSGKYPRNYGLEYSTIYLLLSK